MGQEFSASVQSLAGVSVDWRLPWFGPYREIGQRVGARWNAGESLAQALNAEERYLSGWPRLAAGPVAFVEQGERPPDQTYEVHIERFARIPTRSGLHDFFNGLVWLRFPEIKVRLNTLHLEHGAGQPVGERRSVVRDALTLFDENGAIWCAPDTLYHAIRDREWLQAFVEYRSAWARSNLILLGHGLLEKLCSPRKNMIAHVWRVSARAAVEMEILERLEAGQLRQRPWCPIPVLGVPGWWPANEEPEFYRDPGVFRPASVRSARARGEIGPP